MPSLSARILQFLDRFTWRMPSYQRLAGEQQELMKERETLIYQRDVLEGERDDLSKHTRRLVEEAADHAQREEEWKQERARLLNQRDALEQERDELSRHARHLEDNLAESHRREQQLARLLAEATKRRDELQAERNDLKARYTALNKDWTALNRLLPFPPGHFYSPVVDPEAPQVADALAAGERLDDSGLAGIRADRGGMIGWFERISRQCTDIPFPEEKSPDYRYYFQNPAFGYADAAVLFGMLRELQPKKLVEVGVGHSSCVVLDTVERYLGSTTELTFIDPYPEVLEGLLSADDPARLKILAEPVQKVPLDLFAALGQNDILFLDTSHVAKTGSDVNDYLFRVLPALQPGVVVHVHDIFYPFEYSPEWILEERRSWNEAYVLRAFLQYNDAFEVIFFNNYFFRKHTGLVREKMPRCLEDGSGSIWLRKVR